jgi:hypothetical protein
LAPVRRLAAFWSWYIECENGSRSLAHDTIEQARAALRAIRSVQAQMDPNYSKPVRFVSSEGEVSPLEVDQARDEPAAAPDELP